MTEPTETRFTRTLGGPSYLRIIVVVGAFLVLVMSAALTMAASPAPTGGSAPAPLASLPPWGGQGAGPLDGHGFMGGPGVGKRGGEFMMPGFGIRGFGQISITAISGSNVSLRTVDGWTRTITLTSSTKITKAGQAISLGDLRVGDEVRFHQVQASDGSFTIDALEVVLPRVGGEVTATGAGTITIKLPDGTSSTIHVSATTTYLVPGVQNPSLSDITVGMRVVAEGTKAADGSIAAERVFALPAGRDGWGRGMHGWGPRQAPASPAPSTSPSGSSGGA